MNRLKTYDATGIAPNGRLYAGDLNLLQDTVAALQDYAQALAVGSLAIGAADTTLTHFGAQEMAVSGLMRVLGIFRAQSGLLSGSYTTTARDAIVSPPYGLVILNSTLNTYQWNSGTPSVPVWTGLGGGGFLPPGTLAARPAAGAGNAGQMYLANDQNGGTLYGSTGAAWVQLAAGITAPPTLVDNTVSGSKLVDGSVTAAKLAPLTIDVKGTSYTLVLTDAGHTMRMDGGGTLTVPSNASVPFPVGTVIDVIQWGASQVALAPAGGVTLVGNPGLRTNGQYTMASLIKMATDTWVAVGNLTT
jgi:hypothetical protein